MHEATLGNLPKNKKKFELWTKFVTNLCDSRRDKVLL